MAANLLRLHAGAQEEPLVYGLSTAPWLDQSMAGKVTQSQPWASRPAAWKHASSYLQLSVKKVVFIERLNPPIKSLFGLLTYKCALAAIATPPPTFLASAWQWSTWFCFGLFRSFDFAMLYLSCARQPAANCVGSCPFLHHWTSSS